MSEWTVGWAMGGRAIRDPGRWGLAAAVTALLAAATPAVAGRYAMVRQWPTGIHAAMSEMAPADAPDCNHILDALNARGDLPQRYSWLSPPGWSGPVTPVHWSPVADADKIAILKAESEARCSPTLCAVPPGFWDTDHGRRRARDIVANGEIQFEWAKVALDGDTAATFVRTHRVSDETGPTAGEDAGLFNSGFDVLLGAAPVKVAPVEPTPAYADIVMVGGRALFYGYSSREAVGGRPLNHPQSLIVVGRPQDLRHPTAVLTLCEMAYRPGPHERPGRGPLDPGFDCTAARGRLEHFICGKAYLNLGPLDATMAEAYRAAVRHAKDKVRYASAQRRWLAAREARCPIGQGPNWRDQQTADCLRGVYDLRIARLRSDAGPGDPFAHLTSSREGAVSQDADKNERLLAAAASGDLVAVDQLLNSGTGLDLTDGLYSAAFRGSAPMVRRLIAAGAAPNGLSSNGGRSAATPLFVALELDHRQAADILMDHGGSIFSASDKTPLLSHAVMTGRIALVRQALATHPDIDARDRTDPRPEILGDTALTVAIKRGYREIAAVLLDAGADPNLVGEEGAPLAMAETLSGDKQIARLLRAHGGRKAAEPGR
jgi:uncharacterized protein